MSQSETPVKEQPTASRSDWVDTFRGICIIFVVIGHVLGGLVYTDGIEVKDGLKTIYSWIYSFHMPAFFWVSGLFAYRSYQKMGLVKFIGNKASTLYYPYLLWGILGWLIHMSVSKYTNTPPNIYAPLTLIWNPTSGHWFLIVLFFMMVIAGIIFRLNLKWYGVLAVSLVGWYASEFMTFKDPIPLLSSAGHFGVFFAIGIAMSSYVLEKVQTLKPLASFWMFLFGALVFAAAYYLCQREVIVGNYVIPALTAIIWLVGLSRLLSDSRAMNWLKSCGKHSLQIYLLHAYPTVLSRIILLKVFHIQDIRVHAIVNSVFGIIACLAVSVFLEKIGFTWLFRFPERKKRI